MKPKHLAILNLVALGLLFVDFVPYNKEISGLLILVVSIMLLLK